MNMTSNETSEDTNEPVPEVLQKYYFCDIDEESDDVTTWTCVEAVDVQQACYEFEAYANLEYVNGEAQFKLFVESTEDTYTVTVTDLKEESK
jgi:hypothetical protein